MNIPVDEILRASGLSDLDIARSKDIRFRTFCTWCNDRGCPSCDGGRARQRALDEEYKRQFPDGPKPIFTAHLDKPEEVEQLVEIFHADKIREAFGEGGEGMTGIERKSAEAMKARAARKQ